MSVTVPKKDIWKAVRSKCLDCCCGQVQEVELCPSQDCPLWLYRFGKSLQSREKHLANMREKALNLENETKDNAEAYNLMAYGTDAATD